MTVAGNILLTSIPVLVSLYAGRWEAVDRATVFMDKPLNHNLPVTATYDFIIVGGGTAGLILANRLSEKYSVLVLEAGGRPVPLTSVPGIAMPISEVGDINFLYRSTPQKNAARERSGVVPITAGKMLGGSSSHNYMAWEHGHASDYDRWAYLVKDVSWRYENLVKYFRQIEKYRTIMASHHHKGHYTPYVPEQSLLSVGQHLWFEAGRELGYNIRDPRKPQSIGFNPIIYSTSNGLRASSYTLYLEPILSQLWRRLKIFKYSFASKILFHGNTAIGVEYERHGVARAAFALKEVILSAGTFVSPIILFKSGIGPRDQVRAANAERHLAELPVGLNLQDHPVVPIDSIFVKDPHLTWSLERNLSFHDVDQFTKDGRSPLSTPFHGSEAFIRSDQIYAPKKSGSGCGLSCWPDLQIYFNPTGPTPNTLNCGVSNAQPTSRGVLSINSSATSMADNNLPILDYKYFDTERDFDVTMAGINFCLQVIEGTRAFQNVDARLLPYDPCARMHHFRSPAYWKCYVRHRASTGYHSSGTCRMGHSKSDPKAVVDSKFKVIGVQRLRVVDGSVMPHITNANIMAPIMVLAEKAASDILKEHSLIGQKKFHVLAGGK